VKGNDSEGNPLPSGNFVDPGEIKAGVDGVELILAD